MSTDIPASLPDNGHDIDVVGRSSLDADDDLWGDVPRDQRLAWLRVASHNWPFHPGAAVGGNTARALSQGQPVRSTGLIRVARNAFEAGFTPDEYALLRRLIRWRVPARFVIRRDRRPEHADDYYEIDAAQWREWLDEVRAGTPAEVAIVRFLAPWRRELRGDPSGLVPESTAPHVGPHAGVEDTFARGHSPSGWGLPLRARHGDYRRGYPWFRVMEVFPPVRGARRTGTGKYQSDEEGDAWTATLLDLSLKLEGVGFTPQDLYTLYLTLDRLTDDQWARVDKRLFTGDGVHTRKGWMLAPIPEKWAAWPRLVHEEGLLPHEATERVLGGVWSEP